MKSKIITLSVLIAFLGPTSLYAKKEEEKWNEHKGSHFIIYYKNAPQDFVKSVEDSAEQYYDEITSNLGFTRYESWSFDDRASIYIYDDSDHYIAESRQANWSHGAASPQPKIIRTFPTAHGFFDSTLPHELGHIIFREFVGFRAQMPLWFEEGVAMYQEKARRFGANRTVQNAIKDGSFISLPELSHVRLTNKTKPEVVDLFYAEAASIVYYLFSEQGDFRFVQFCRKLSEGNPFDWALKSVYIRFNSLEDLNKSWLSYLEK